MKAAAILLGLVALAAGLSCGGEFAMCAGDSCTEECQLSLVVTPSEPYTTDLVQVSASVSGTAGLVTVAWGVSNDGADVAFEVDGTDGDVIVFDPAEAGVYEVTAFAAASGESCDDTRSINVTLPGATIGAYRLRIVPLDPGVPAQDVDITIPSGGDHTLGTVNAGDGVLADGTALGPGDAPLAGYLRATAPDQELAPLLAETFAGADGVFALELLARPYDLLVVPDAPAIAPALFPGVSPADLDTLALDAGDLVGGTVVDGAGDPVVGARVALTVGGVPSTVAVTGGGGGFSLRARAGGPVAVTVVPDPASGLAQLELDAPDGSAIAGGGTIDVAYATLATRTVAPAVRMVDGTTPAPGARVTLRAHPIDAAGTVTIDGTDHPARGTLLRSAVADGGGDLPAQIVPRAEYDVVVEAPAGAPPAQGVRLLALDLVAAGAPATLSLASPARIAGQVVDAAGDPIDRARVRAEPRGALSGMTSAGDAVTVDADGMFDLRLAGGGTYDLVVDGTPAGQPRARVPASAGAAGTSADLGAVALQPALRIDGTLARIGDVPVRAHLELICLDCDGGPVSVAETVSDATGQFLLIVPDRP